MPRSRSVIVYYAVFALGLAMMVMYAWWLAEADSIGPLLGFTLLDYALFAASTLAISFSRSRAVRTALTLLSAALGGIQGYLDLVLFPQPYNGLVLFLWAAFGVLLTMASLSWLHEYSRPKRGSAIENKMPSLSLAARLLPHAPFPRKYRT